MPRRRYCREDLLEAARELAHEHGERLTVVTFVNETGISQATIGKHFGRWSELRKAVGLKPRPPKEFTTLHITREELIEQLKGLACQQGGEVTLHQFCRKCGYGPATVYRHFGTWTSLRRAAGLAPRFRMPRTYTDEELLKELAQVCRLLRKFPTNDQINQLSRFSISTYLRRFGNKRALRQAFDEWLLARQRRDPYDIKTIARFDRTDDPPQNNPWLMHHWRDVRISFLVRSSHLQRFHTNWPDLLIVEIHDWPDCPCPVHQIGDLLGKRLKALTMKAKTGPKRQQQRDEPPRDF